MVSQNWWITTAFGISQSLLKILTRTSPLLQRSNLRNRLRFYGVTSTRPAHSHAKPAFFGLLHPCGPTPQNAPALYKSHQYGPPAPRRRPPSRTAAARPCSIPKLRCVLCEIWIVCLCVTSGREGGRERGREGGRVRKREKVKRQAGRQGE